MSVHKVFPVVSHGVLRMFGTKFLLVKIIARIIRVKTEKNNDDDMNVCRSPVPTNPLPRIFLLCL